MCILAPCPQGQQYDSQNNDGDAQKIPRTLEHAVQDYDQKGMTNLLLTFFIAMEALVARM
jgi:hypothetical protein